MKVAPVDEIAEGEVGMRLRIFHADGLWKCTAHAPMYCAVSRWKPSRQEAIAEAVDRRRDYLRERA